MISVDHRCVIFLILCHVFFLGINKSSRLEVNCSASSEYPEPERMLLATGEDEGTTKELEQSAVTEKGVTESDGSVDHGVSTRGRKRQLTESSPQLIGSLTKKSRAGRNTDNIPDDDDVLASILGIPLLCLFLFHLKVLVFGFIIDSVWSFLVGRSSLKLKSTPPLTTLTPSKRQRSVAKTKRKVFLDEIMVLHPEYVYLFIT